MLGTRLAGSTSPYRKVVQDEAPKAAKRLTARERSSLSRVIKNIVVASRRARQEEAGRRRRRRGWRLISRRGVGAGVGAAQASARAAGLEARGRQRFFGLGRRFFLGGFLGGAGARGLAPFS